MAECIYCTEDREGWAMFLPREGTGITASIHYKTFGGKAIVLRGQNKTRVEIPINFCPICGRGLKKGGA